MVMRFT
jgi:hypothetical protein